MAPIFARSKEKAVGRLPWISGRLDGALTWAGYGARRQSLMQVSIVEALHLGVLVDSLRLPPPVSGRAFGVLYGWVCLQIPATNIRTALVESIEIDAGNQRPFVILDGLPFHDRCQRYQVMSAQAAVCPDQPLGADPILKIVQHGCKDDFRPTGIDGETVGVGEEIALQ